VSAPARIAVPLYYDFASTLCYVAHRVLGRIAQPLEELGIELCWTPIDLAGLLNWKRGHPVSTERRANATRVSQELGVSLSVPPCWLDSRTAMALTLRIDAPELEAGWRERMWSLIFETESPLELDERCIAVAEQLGLDVSHSEIEAGNAELEKRTLEAAAASVVGAPTLLLGGWPIGGIQEAETMLSMLGRYARRVREDQSAEGALH
jgi:2-hydroxychromene-2-carboxylate isomerase